MNLLQHIRRSIILAGTAALLMDDLAGQQELQPYPDNCPRERIEVHLSAESLFTDEILWFKIYCSSTLPDHKAISSLAFIELVSFENEVVLRKKVLLRTGEGSGEFRIPAGLHTGLYHIIAYTGWMKNFGEAAFFHHAVPVINPYLAFDFPSGPEGPEMDECKSYSWVPERDSLRIVPDKKTYSQREKVTLNFVSGSETGRTNDGHYSVSVSRQEPVMVMCSRKPAGMLPAGRFNLGKTLPDYRGIILAGKVVDQSENIVPGARIDLSLPGAGTEVMSSVTESDGRFSFRLKPAEGEQDVVVTLPAAGDKLILDESFWNGFRVFPGNMRLRSAGEIMSFLREKFAYYQLQNRFGKKCYDDIRPLINEPDSSVFYSGSCQVIDMQRYILLDSLREYFYELAPYVRFSGKSGEYVTSVLDPVSMVALPGKPGIFLDGVLYDDFSPVANIPPGEISRIKILPAVYYYRDLTFGGIIDIRTRKSDFSAANLLPNMSRFIFPMANPPEYEFQSPDYSGSLKTERSPDLRYLLYWTPDIKKDEYGVTSVHFFTGDIPGSYLIRAVGISGSGELISAETEIIVK